MVARAKRKAPARKTRARKPRRPLVKMPTGIEGFDEITTGGLPRGRTTLVLGGPGRPTWSPTQPR